MRPIWELPPGKAWGRDEQRSGHGGGMGGGDRGTGRLRPGPGGGGEIQPARLHGGGF